MKIVVKNSYFWRVSGSKARFTNIKRDQFETFNTMHGFDTNYIEGLLRELAGEGINATYLFKQTMPTGTMSYTGHSGIFEVYVSKESVDQAQDYIQKKLGHK